MDTAQVKSEPQLERQVSRAVRQTVDDEYEIDLLELLYRLIEKAKWIAAAAVVGGVLALLITAFAITPLYEATAKLYVMNSDDAAINLSDLQIGTYLTADYQEVFSNWHVHERVISRLGLPYSYEELAGMLKVTNPKDTRVLYITVTAKDAQQAKEIADAYASVAREFIAATMDTREPNLFEEALLPSYPASPSMTKNVLLGMIACAGIACIVIIVQFLLDDRIRTSDDLEKYFGIPTLGLLPRQESSTSALRRKRNSGEGSV